MIFADHSCSKDTVLAEPTNVHLRDHVENPLPQRLSVSVSLQGTPTITGGSLNAMYATYATSTSKDASSQAARR